MREEDKIITRYGRDTGYRVPEGYFETLRQEVLAELPKRTAIPAAPPLTLWQKIRPYVYMAAMFAGIWCMMKMFHTMSHSAEISLDRVPNSVALAVADLHDENWIAPSSDIEDTELIYSLSDRYSSIDEFEADFGVEIDPKYASLGE
ncbi:MAG: hypothetical protein K2O24_03260 [Muribaculaceae bacterium]|nr:hypothetical protein [Muribaculaceae bacterium]